MSDLLTQVKAKVESFGYEVSLKRFDTMTGKEGIYLSPVQPTVVEAYMDGSEELLQPYQFVVRNRESQQAADICADIAAQLENESIESLDGSYRWICGDIYEYPQELDFETEGFYVWVCQMQAHIITN